VGGAETRLLLSVKLDGGPMGYVEWRVRCVAEEGFYVGQWRRWGNLRWRLHHEYGPLISREIFDVLEADISSTLFELALQELRDFPPDY
jgi:hypothetical protein